MTDRTDGEAGLYAEKKQLRLVMNAKLKAVSAGERAQRSQAAAVIASGLPVWTDASLILAFLSMPSEIDTMPALECALGAGKRVAVPRIDDGDLAFIELKGNWRSWPLDRWSIPTPPADASVLPAALIASIPCLALVPGLAFDRTGGRLGRGKGYYDRFLASVQAAADDTPKHAGPKPFFFTLAYGYDFQLIPRVPMGQHDVRLQDLALG
jgi:5-formyltetrahydrofolate cyclo-ligase